MNDVTQILQAIERGDPVAAEQLLPLLYEELRRLAAQRLSHEQPGQTLLATVNWIGGSGDWSTASNWSNGTGPGADDDAVINSVLGGGSDLTKPHFRHGRQLLRRGYCRSGLGRSKSAAHRVALFRNSPRGATEGQVR